MHLRPQAQLPFCLTWLLPISACDHGQDGTCCMCSLPRRCTAGVNGCQPAWGWLNPLSFPGDRCRYLLTIYSDLPLETCLLSLGQIGLMLTSSTWERKAGSQAEGSSGACSEPLRPEISSATVWLRVWTWAADSLLLLLKVFCIQKGHLGKKKKQLGVCRDWTPSVQNYVCFGRGHSECCWIFRHRSNTALPKELAYCTPQCLLFSVTLNQHDSIVHPAA